MIYVYDILLNWSDNILYDFFEWEKTDNLEHIKRISLFKVEKGIINKFIYNNIKIDVAFIDRIYNTAESYSSKKINKIPYAFIITDGITALAVKTDKHGNVKYRSKLIVDEEDEIICISSKINKVQIDFQEKNKIYDELFVTRNELKIKKYLLNTITNTYKNKKYDKLRYIYKEYTNKDVNDINIIYKELISSFDIMEESHLRIYNLMLTLLVSNH